MNRNSYNQYVHECSHHDERWFVGEANDDHTRYNIPVRGVPAYQFTSDSCLYMPHYATRRQALRAARYIYGGE
jgi:hypothetical protein